MVKFMMNAKLIYKSVNTFTYFQRKGISSKLDMIKQPYPIISQSPITSIGMRYVCVTRSWSVYLHSIDNAFYLVNDRSLFKEFAQGVFTVTKYSNLIGNIIKVMIQVCFINEYSWLVYK